MPKITTLVNHMVMVEKGREPADPKAQGNGNAEMVDTWTIVMMDRATGDVLRLGMKRDLRDEIVRQLTGGIVISGGELPQL